MTIETADGTKLTSLYDGGNIKEKTVTTKDGETTKTVYSDGKKKTTKTDKDGKEIKYTTGEGGDTVSQVPSLEEFLRMKNFGGGYTDGRPELQSDAPMTRDPSRDPYFGVIDVNPDYTEATAGADGTPGRTIGGNIAQPETREDLQGPAPEMPPSAGGNPNSDGSN